MLDESLQDRTKIASLTPYQDPVLRSPHVTMELTARLWDARMLATTTESLETVSLFTVIKKVEIDKTGARVRRTRLVWDERRANERFKRPPRLPPGSAASFSNWDLAEAAIGAGSSVHSFTADLPDWFYRILTPVSLRPFFVFGNMTSTSRASSATCPAAVRRSTCPMGMPTSACRFCRWAGRGPPTWPTRSCSRSSKGPSSRGPAGVSKTGGRPRAPP